MGMAASQARLLCITARIHDVEYQAQAIQNAKVQLATQSDQAYAKYNEALDATTLTIRKIDPKSGTESVIPANFNNLCSKGKVLSAGGDYALFDKHHRLIVTDDIAVNYDKFSGDDAYAFAMFMLNGQAIGNIDGESDDNAGIKLWNSELGAYKDAKEGSAVDKAYNDIVKFIREYADEDFDPGLDIYDSNNGTTIFDGYNDSITFADKTGKKSVSDLKDEYRNKIGVFRALLYQTSAEKIYNLATDDDSLKFDNDEFKYYVNIYNQIKAAGGCVSIEDFRGSVSKTDVANDSDWLHAMVNCGQISIATVDYDEMNQAKFNSTSASSDSSLAETATTTIDARALKKAEAEYEHTLNTINKKDKEYDLSLSKLEAQRTALTTEYDSVKKVISDNIERTFGIFS